MAVVQLPLFAVDIFNQYGGHEFLLVTGAKEVGYVDNDKEKSLSFKLPANPKHIRYVKTILEPTDVYTVQYFNFNNRGRIIKEEKEVYAEDLVDFFEINTGLYAYIA